MKRSPANVDMSLPTNSQWARVSALCVRLQPSSPAERAAILASLRTQGDEDPRVLSLVSLHFAVPPEPDRLRSGDRIGNFTLGDRLGAGGMGVVYQAQQHLGQATRDVAVKLIHPMLLLTAQDDAIERFTAELRALITLEYQGIARIYDGNIYEDPTTHEQIPYLAMELIRAARAITTYAEEHALTPLERLELFLPVCQAVRHAHDRRIVHRDLKPANILVDSDGRPFVIDFGLAQVCDTILPPGSRLVVSGTPAYMSPEQVSDAFGPVSEKSDTYALGLILYELLTNQHPYELSRLEAFEQLCRAITDVVPTPLGQYHTRYRGELEAIIAQTLAKQPAERMTVTVLGWRLERYLRTPQALTVLSLPSQSVPPLPLVPMDTGEGKHYACLIGTNDYEGDVFPQTRYPEANVDALANQLEDNRIGNFDEVIRLKNKTRTEVIRTIKNLSSQLGKNDLLLIYYTGYAIFDEEDTGKLYLAAKDTATDVIPYTSIGIERLQTFLNRCQARQQILILDCHYLNSPEAVSAQMALYQSGTYIISNRPRSVGWRALAQEEAHSLLTKYLIQGLVTGEADLDGDGRVTIEEWFTYVQKQMADRGVPQPWKWDAGVEGAWVIAQTVESGDAAAERRPASLRRTFKELTHMFREGLVIPFLGSGAMPDIHPVEPERAGPEFPLERALGHKLAEVAQELADVSETMHAYPLTIVAQYCQTRMLGGRAQLYNALKRCFPQSITPGPLHRLLVQQDKPLLVVTSAYDTALEQVFREQGTPYAVVTHIAHAEDWESRGKVVVQYSDRPDEPEVWLSDQLSIDLERWWVFYKIQGTFDLFIQGPWGREEIDSILISEEDYFEFLSRLSDQHRTIPTLFNRPFQRRLFLFLGYGMSDWHLRTLVHILRQERRMRQVAGYAVRPNATDLEIQFWKSKNVEIIDMEVGNFSRRLAEEMGLNI